MLLANLAARRGIERTESRIRFDRDAIYDRLAETVRSHLDLNAIYALMGARVES